MKIFELDIVTPEKNVFSGSIQSVTVPGADGSFQVLHNHAAIISTLGEGKVKVLKESGDELSFSAKGGVIEVLNNKAIILVEQIIEN